MHIRQLIISLIVLLFSTLTANSQTATQTIRGTVLDKVSQAPLIGALLIVQDITPTIGTTSDENGNFTLKEVPVGKRTIKVTYMGYKEQLLQNLTVNAGKELVLTINLEEDIVTTQEVEVTAKKNIPLNSMSTVSTRPFSVEETQKYAAAVNDPGRMATSFAGVVHAGDGSNTISIRGNSPNGLLWRMEGVEIPNPNHFTNVGTSGGGISIISSQLLSNSDFFDGCFCC
ncbi:carboxypeptidase-like regulatory domain-containing protein [Oscillatoria amoena NRMC-F 0135]|nr:carboxypeptidase-like regulatory domain-containing protein [Oscillatoria amoena NRMC-F 0135]